MEKKKTTIVFDMGMVLIDFRWKAFLSETMKYDEEKADQIAKAMFRSPLWPEFDLGVMGDNEVIRQMKAGAPEVAADIEEIWKPENMQFVCEPMDYADTLVRSLHEMGYKIYILSNYGKTLLALQREKFTFLNYVDGELISAHEKMMKPDDDIFQRLFEKFEMDPSQAVFFDDVAENCEASRRNGMDAVNVHGYDSIIEGLRAYGVM